MALYIFVAGAGAALVPPEASTEPTVSDQEVRELSPNGGTPDAAEEGPIDLQGADVDCGQTPDADESSEDAECPPSFESSPPPLPDAAGELESGDAPEADTSTPADVSPAAVLSPAGSGGAATLGGAPAGAAVSTGRVSPNPSRGRAEAPPLHPDSGGERPEGNGSRPADAAAERSAGLDRPEEDVPGPAAARAPRSVLLLLPLGIGALAAAAAVAFKHLHKGAALVTSGGHRQLLAAPDGSSPPVDRLLAEDQRGLGAERPDEPDPRYLLIVQRDRHDLYYSLKRRFAVDARVRVLLDRRSGERSEHREDAREERRKQPDFWEDLRFHPAVLVRRPPAGDASKPSTVPETLGPGRLEPGAAVGARRGKEDREMKARMDEVAATEALRQVIQWVEESRDRFTMLLELFDHFSTVEAERRALERENESLKAEIHQLREEREAIMAVLAPMSSLFQRLSVSAQHSAV